MFGVTQTTLASFCLVWFTWQPSPGRYIPDSYIEYSKLIRFIYRNVCTSLAMYDMICCPYILYWYFCKGCVLTWDLSVWTLHMQASTKIFKKSYFKYWSCLNQEMNRSLKFENLSIHPSHLTYVNKKVAWYDWFWLIIFIVVISDNVQVK